MLSILDKTTAHEEDMEMTMEASSGSLTDSPSLNTTMAFDLKYAQFLKSDDDTTDTASHMMKGDHCVNVTIMDDRLDNNMDESISMDLTLDTEDLQTITATTTLHEESRMFPIGDHTVLASIDLALKTDLLPNNDSEKVGETSSSKFLLLFSFCTILHNKNFTARTHFYSIVFKILLYIYQQVKSFIIVPYTLVKDFKYDFETFYQCVTGGNKKNA